MQAPTTMTRGNGFNRLTAGAIGLALLAASVLGAVALNERVELPLIGGSSEISAPANTTTKAKIEFFEQNSFDYAVSAPIDPFFLEANSFDYQPVANSATADSIRFNEDNVFEYAATPMTSEQVRFHEENVWEPQGHARTAGDADAAGAAQDYRFLEENVWEQQSQMLPPTDTGARDY